MTSLPCPNPTCTHRFAPAEIKGATALKCPRCGTVFEFRAQPGSSGKMPALPAQPARPAPPPAVPARTPTARPASPPPKPAAPKPAAPSAAPPVARPVPPPLPPIAQPGKRKPDTSPSMPAFGLDDAGDEHDVELLETEAPATPLVRARPRNQGSLAKKLIIGAVALLVVGGAIGGVVVLLDKLPNNDDTKSAGGGQGFKGEIRNAENALELVFRLVAVPKSAWKQEASIRGGLKAIVALQRSEPDVWVAVAAKDYGTRKPRKAELVKEAKDRLENHFGETLEWQEKPDDKSFAGQPRAQCYEFKGDVKQVTWHGECRMFSQRGVGYWFFLAAPTLEEAQLALTELQKDKSGFMLADSRSGWREQPPKTKTVRGAKLPISVQVSDEVWDKHDRAEDVDERGDLFLTGRFLQEKDNRKNASVLVLTLDKKGDLKEGLKAARLYFEEKIKDEDKDNVISSISEKGDDAGVSELIANRPGRRLELKVQRGPQPTRYILLAVTEIGDQVVAIRCQSTWENRQIWRQDFLDLLGTLKVTKK